MYARFYVWQHFARLHTDHAVRTVLWILVGILFIDGFYVHVGSLVSH